MEKVKPLKKFGQNYLKDQNILNNIIKEIDPKQNENIIEIGPGLGSLTEKLNSFPSSLTAIEIDKRVIDSLSVRFPGINLINKDFLKVDLHSLYKNPSKKLRIVGNIPYYLTSSIIFKLIENHSLISDSIIMVQHEVAQRITAVKGTKEYGILSLILSYFADIKFCFKVSPNVFYPRPKVFSSLIHIYFKDINETEEEQKAFIRIVKAAFGNRRKTLKNSLGTHKETSDFDFTLSGVDLSLRAEQLDINDFKKLSKFIISKTP